MTGHDAPPLSAWALSIEAAKLFAVDPAGTSICLRARPGPQRDRWFSVLRDLMQERPLRKVPLTITDDRLLGGLDLAATLAAAKPVAEHGVLAEADGGAIVLSSAERLSVSLAARIAATHDRGEIQFERDGFNDRLATHFGIIAIDEALEGDESPPAALMDRIAFRCDLSTVTLGETKANSEYALDAEQITAARQRLANVIASDKAIEALCAAASAFGIASTRAPILALRAAKAAAALAGHDIVEQEDLALAAQLVFSWRATAIPQSEDDEDQAEDVPEPETGPDQNDSDAPDQSDVGELDDIVLDAIRAALPPDLLAELIADRTAGTASGMAGRAGALQKSGKRGRRIGSMRGDPRSGARLDLVATLRAAALWQKIRQRTNIGRGENFGARLQVRSGDFRTIRFAERRETLTIFAVDASGSLALNRLAEAKGAVELLLADCYIRRDQVALIAFRGKRADLLLPPTRSLVRAKRSLSSLPGGGGTPLASAIDASGALAQSALRRGQTPLIVMLTDGRANIARDGQPGRTGARTDALVSARMLQEQRVRTLLIDTSPRAEPRAEELAAAMGADYLALPQMDAGLISGVVKNLWTKTGTKSHG